MRILHINLEPGWRGGERQTIHLMKGLNELGYENHLVVRKNMFFIHQALAHRLIAKTINKPFFLHGGLLRKFDIIQLHEVRGLQLAASWKFYHSRPLVYTRRVDNMPSNHAFTRFKYNQVDRLVTISKKIKSVMIEWGFDPGRISVIPSAVGAEKKSDQAGRVQKLKQRFCGHEVVGCVAALEKRKDHFTLLKVAALIKRHRKDVVFLLIGDGTLRAELEARAREMDLDNVVFEGFQDDPYSYYPIFDVFLMTSKSEGLGSAILDSFSCRIPVVATAAGGIPDIVKHEQTGLLAPVQNPEMIAQLILKILDDTNLRMRVTQNAYHLVKRDYCITKMAKAYGNIYQELVSG